MMFGRQLERWVWREVHGEDLPRKRGPRREHRGPARNWKYRAWIRSLPCAVCGLEPCGEAHHTGERGLGQQASDYTCIPLCSDCHTQAPHAYHRLGREGWERTANRYLEKIMGAAYSHGVPSIPRELHPGCPDAD